MIHANMEDSIRQQLVPGARVSVLQQFGHRDREKAWSETVTGTVVDLRASSCQVACERSARSGSPAIHTVYVRGTRFILRLIPSGILHPGITCVIGNGVVVDPQALFAEVDELARHGIDVGDRIVISDKAHLILPYHRDLDLLS